MQVRNVKSAAQTRAETLMARFAGQFGVEPEKLYQALKSNFADRDGSVPTSEEMLAIMLVAEQYGLNPFTREIFAFKGKNGRYQPMISVDGWTKIVTRQADFDGVEFKYSASKVSLNGREYPESCTAVIYRKGITHPIAVSEYLIECYMGKSPVWQMMPMRMIRHRAYIQAARVAFGITGLGDAEDLNGYGEDGGEMVNAPGSMPAALPASAAPAIAMQPAAPAGFAQIGQPLAVPAARSMQERFDRLMAARGKYGEQFWEKAELSIARDQSTDEAQKQWLVGQLRAARNAEASAAAAQEPEPAASPVKPQAEAAPQPQEDDLMF